MNSEARKRQPPSAQQVLAARATILKTAGVVGLHVEDENADDVLIMLAGDIVKVLTEAVEIVVRHDAAPPALEVLTCSAEGCTEAAVEMLTIKGNPGHVHDCARDAAALREFCDVASSAPINSDGSCPAEVCTGNRHIWFGDPTPLDPGAAS